MGSALTNQIISIAGSKGGVGCSSFTALISITLSKNKNHKIAILDGTPFHQSM